MTIFYAISGTILGFSVLMATVAAILAIRNMTGGGLSMLDDNSHRQFGNYMIMMVIATLLGSLGLLGLAATFLYQFTSVG